MFNQTIKYLSIRFFGLAFGVVGLMPASFAAGLLNTVDSNLPALEILSHEVEVTIQDGFVTTSVEQVFSNPGFEDTQAVYSFPIPEGAVVSEFTVWIDDQPVTGEVIEKQKARQIYTQEKAAGRDTGLVEQNGAQRFEVNVSPLRAGRKTRIRLQYLQVTDIQTGIGRYLYPLESGDVDAKQLSFWTANEQVAEHFRLRLHLRSTYPIEALRAPNISDAVVTQSAPGEWTLEIDRRAQSSTERNMNEAPVSQPTSGSEGAITNAVLQTNNEVEALSLRNDYNQARSAGENQAVASRLDQDIVMYWRMARDLPGSVDVIAHREPGQSKGTFMITLTPGDDLKPIEQGRDWIFVLDISGSMEGKYATLAEGVRMSFERMKSGDRFRIVLFNDHARELSNGWTEITPATVSEYSDRVSSVKPGGGTNLFAGVKKGLQRIDKHRTTGLILVSDGVANVGETHKRGLLKLIRNYDVRLFSFIMGNEANRPLLKSIAEQSNGFALSISNSDDIVGKIMEATQRMNHEAMHHVALKLNGVRFSDLTQEKIMSVYRGQQIVIFGHYWESGWANLELNARISGQPKRYSTKFNLPETAGSHPEIERMWAFAKLKALQNEAELLDDDGDVNQLMTGLAVEYGLVSEHTSMVVMREDVFQQRGIKRRNADRVTKEHKAQQQRASQAVKSSRIESQDKHNPPMFDKPSATHVGVGAFDIAWLILLSPMLIGVMLQHRKHFKASV